MEQQAPTFELFHNTSFGEDKVSAVLSFRKSEEHERYYFNKYQAVVRPVNPLLIAGQSFYINKGSNVTLKEAYNLLRGRAVEKELTSKEGMVYKAWLQLDFRHQESNGNYKVQQFHQNYGFDLEQALAKHPIKELGNEQEKSRLLEALRKGNQPAVTFLLGNGSEEKRFIEASPQYKSINIYNENMLRVRQTSGEKVAPAQSAVQEHKKERRQQATGSEEENSAAKRRTLRKGKSLKP
jgi:hypothetical protein